MTIQIASVKNYVLVLSPAHFFRKGTTGIPRNGSWKPRLNKGVALLKVRCIRVTLLRITRLGGRYFGRLWKKTSHEVRKIEVLVKVDVSTVGIASY